MHTQVHVLKNSGQLVPTSLWEQAVKHNTTGMGIASTRLNGMVAKGLEAPTIEALSAFQEAHKEHAVLFHMFEAVDGFKEEDIQPLVLLKEQTNGKDDVQLCVLLDGEFPTFVESDGHSPEWHCAFDYLKDKAEFIYAKTKGDMAKFMDHLRTDNFKKELIGVIGEGNSVIFLSNTGEIMMFGPALLVEKKPWGWSTNYYNTVEGAYPARAEEPQAMVTKKPTMKELLAKAEAEKKAKGQNPLPQTLQAVATKDKGPTLGDLNNTTVIQPDILPGTGIKDPAQKVWIVPGSDLGQNKKANWYHRFKPGMSRDQWVNSPPIEVTAIELVKFSNYKIVEAPKGLAALAGYQPFVDPSKKDTNTHNLPEVTPATPLDDVQPKDGKLVAVIPRIPADETKRLVAIVQGVKSSVSPEQFRDLEKKYGSFLDAVGLKSWAEMDGYSFDDYLKIADGNMGAAKFMFNLMGYRMRLEERITNVTRPAEVPQKIAM